MIENSRIFAVLVMTALMAYGADLYAQGGGPAPPPSANQVPLDGLSMMLLAAGAGYGIRKLRKRPRGK